MAEEKINSNSQNQIIEADAEPTAVPVTVEEDVEKKPKKRGRKKKADDNIVTETLTPPSVKDEGEFLKFPDGFPVSQDEDEPLSPLPTDEASEGNTEVIEEDTEAVAEDVAEESSDEVAVGEAEAVAEDIAEEASDEVAVGEVEAVAEDVAEEALDEVSEEFILPTEFALPSEDENGFLYVEHFADLYDNAAEPEEAEDEEERAPEEELTLDDTVEYENLTILSPEPEEEKPRPTRERREPSADDEPYNPEKQRGVDNRFDIIELFVFTLVIIMLITTFFFKHSVVQGSSMESTLFEGDHLIISDFLYTPKQYDIVVVHDPEAHADGPMVKRIIATENQTVTLRRMLVDEKSKPNKPYYILKVSVDGVPVRDDFVYYTGSDDIPIDTYFEDFTRVFSNANGEERFEYVVPEGEVFVMGDHRDNSKDSREFGSIKEETILGRVLIRIFPFDSFGKIED